jgi:glycosyltransferase involved in cell wall biosynthesis
MAPATPLTNRTFAIIGADTGSLIGFRGHLMTTLVKDGYQVHAIGPQPSAGQQAWFKKRGIAFHSIRIARNSLSPLRDIALYFELRKILRRIKPATLLSYMIKPTVFGIPAATAAGVPYRYALVNGLGYAFTERHGSLSWTLVNRVARLLYRNSLKRTSGVMFQNPDDAALFSELKLIPAATRRKIVNGSGVDIDYFAPAPLPAEPRFLMAARLLRDKGIAEYIAAAQTVRKSHPKATFHLVGPKDPNPSGFPFEEIMKAHDAGDIVYHDAVDDIRPLIAQSRVYVLPSYREGTPRSVLEAMSMGRPIITTSAPGCRETVINGNNGLIVKPRDHVSLAEAMQHLIDNPADCERMGQTSRAIAARKYDVRVVTADIMRFCLSD